MKCFVWFAALLLASAAWAGEVLRAEIKPLALQARTQAPETLDVKLTWTGAGLLEGVLELSFRDGEDDAPRFRTHELALTEGPHTYRFLIPASNDESRGSPRELRARFIGKTRSIDLGRFDLGMQKGWGRSFTICVSRPRFGAGTPEFPLWQSLRLERLQPADPQNNEPASTLPVYVEAEEMPTSPLAYCAYDLVVLEGEGFLQLREKQLAALTRWVLGGGSLCVLGGAHAQAEHQRFLDHLLAADPRSPALDLDGGRRLVRPGFGRLVVMSAAPQSETETETPEWRRAITFLWKFRPAQVDHVLQDGTWNLPTTRPDASRINDRQRALSGVLAPKEVQILPRSLVVLILGLFVVVIGPLDWIVLGRLRARRLTWVLFPVASVVFTGITVWLAERFMGSTNQRSALTVTDLGIDGRVLRESRFEMIFPARNQEVATDVRNALLTPMSTSTNNYSGGQGMGVAAGSYAGQFPARYSVHQALRQWTPQTNRTFSLEDGEDLSGVPWAELDPRQTVSIEGRERLRRLGVQAPADSLHAFYGGKFWDGTNLPLSGEFVRSLCQPHAFHWMTVCSQLSPNGAGNFDDLTLAPDGDPDIALSIVVRKEGENFHVYRRLYAP